MVNSLLDNPDGEILNIEYPTVESILDRLESISDLVRDEYDLVPQGKANNTMAGAFTTFFSYAEAVRWRMSMYFLWVPMDLDLAQQYRVLAENFMPAVTSSANDCIEIVRAIRSEGVE